MTKTCSRCKKTKPLSDFFKKSAHKDGYESHCRACARKYQRQHYERNKQFYFDKNLRRQKHLSEICYRAKDRPCADCKTKYPPYVMDFDHLRDKDMPVSRLVKFGSITRLKREIAKCEVVCANCHRERTHQRKISPS